MKKILCVAVLLGNQLLGVTHAAQVSPKEEMPEAKIKELVKLPSGDLLFAVRIYAAKNKILFLSGPIQKPVKGGPKDDFEDEPLPSAFSLSGSTLTDEYSGKVYSNLPSIPDEPYFGPMDVLTSVSPGGWVQLGLAFPRIPDPPLDKEGKTQPYRLLFEIPKLNIKTELILDPKTLKPISSMR